MAHDTIILQNATRDLHQLPSALPVQPLTLTIPEFRAVITVPRFSPRAIIGRFDLAAQQSPDIDLSPYRAYQKGVSRRHAAIQFMGQQPQVVDLGGVNGTFLNGERLMPHQPYPLRTGDELRLGRLALRVTL